MKRQMEEETCQEPLEAELMLLPPRRTRDNGRRSQHTGKVLVFRLVLCSVSFDCLFSCFDSLVFGSQEFEASCVLEGRIAWLQSVFTEFTSHD